MLKIFGFILRLLLIPIIIVLGLVGLMFRLIGNIFMTIGNIFGSCSVALADIVEDQGEINTWD